MSEKVPQTPEDYQAALKARDLRQTVDGDHARALEMEGSRRTHTSALAKQLFEAQYASWASDPDDTRELPRVMAAAINHAEDFMKMLRARGYFAGDYWPFRRNP